MTAAHFRAGAIAKPGNSQDLCIARRVWIIESAGEPRIARNPCRTPPGRGLDPAMWLLSIRYGKAGSSPGQRRRRVPTLEGRESAPFGVSRWVYLEAKQWPPFPLFARSHGFITRTKFWTSSAAIRQTGLTFRYTMISGMTIKNGYLTLWVVVIRSQG